MLGNAGKTFIELLETIKINDNNAFAGCRMPVQYVNRPNLDFRGFCGTVCAGEVFPGDAVQVLPSGKQSKVKAIVTAEGELSSAIAGEAITITLEDEIDISRGDVIVKGAPAPATVSDSLLAEVVWMEEAPLVLGKEYLFKVGTKSSYGRIVEIKHRIDVNTMQHISASELQLNEVALVAVQLNSPVVFDSYKASKGTGSLVVIDRMSNITIAAGMIESAVEVQQLDAVPYEQRLAAFNAGVAVLARKYFPEK